MKGRVSSADEEWDAEQAAWRKGYEMGRTPSLEDTCPRGGEDLPCTCYQGPTFAEMTREELERAAERWRQRAIAAETAPARTLSSDGGPADA